LLYCYFSIFFGYLFAYPFRGRSKGHAGTEGEHQHNYQCYSLMDFLLLQIHILPPYAVILAYVIQHFNKRVA